jgi:ubiquinone/menaquinone biosynthesis C-methylase UbiE
MLKKKTEKNEMAFGKIPAYCKYELFMERYRSGAEFIEKHSILTKGMNRKVLDVGCGEGYMKYFFDKSPDLEWHGVEQWDERRELCKSLGYQVYNLDINEQSLPFDNGTFDVVIASHVVEHLSNMDYAVREMDRVLKTGGILLIAVPSKLPPFPFLINLYFKFKQFQIGETQNAFSPWSIQSKMKEILGESKYVTIDIRGFRVFSARRRLNLENSWLFYKLSTWLGRICPAITPETNLIMRKVRDE